MGFFFLFGPYCPLSNISVYITEHVYNILEKYLNISIIYLSMGEIICTSIAKISQ